MNHSDCVPVMRKILALIGAIITGGVGIAFMSSVQAAHASLNGVN